MTDDERTKCHAIIHTASAACAAVGGGLAQLPGSDTIPITAAQITMIISLGAVFGKTFSEAAARAFLSGLVASMGGRFISQVLVGWIPFLGNAINATTAAGITEKIGWDAAYKFDSGIVRKGKIQDEMRERQIKEAVIEAVNKTDNVVSAKDFFSDETFTVHGDIGIADDLSVGDHILIAA